jgi:hypothetical protein
MVQASGVHQSQYHPMRLPSFVFANRKKHILENGLPVTTQVAMPQDRDPSNTFYRIDLIPVLPPSPYLLQTPARFFHFCEEESATEAPYPYHTLVFAQGLRWGAPGTAPSSSKNGRI